MRNLDLRGVCPALQPQAFPTYILIYTYERYNDFLSIFVDPWEFRVQYPLLFPSFVPELQAPPPPVGQPLVSNVAAYAVDVSWAPPVDYWHALAVTGYQVWCSSAALLRFGNKGTA